MSDDIDIQKGNFQVAVSAGNHDEVARYISRGANPAWKHGGLSALHGAARNGHVRTAELLLDYGWDLEAVADAGANGCRPLHFAAGEGHVQCR